MALDIFETLVVRKYGVSSELEELARWNWCLQAMRVPFQPVRVSATSLLPVLAF